MNGSIDPEESKSDIGHALSLHPFKNQTYLYRMQMYIHGLQVKELEKHTYQMQEDIVMANNAYMEIADVRSTIY